MSRPSFESRRAFTIIELIAVLAIIAILVALVLPNFSTYLRYAQGARCMSNMRSIATALHAYLQDNEDIWPQGPAPDAGPAWESFWQQTLLPYGISAQTWQCPGIRVDENESGVARVHYTPTMFPPVRGIARKWPTHPWLIERGEGHGHGALICFSDGTVKPFDKVLAELGVRW